MLQINGKTFMNLQEAVQWLLDNNALPFQSSANYVANTEIGLGTIVNPSPAKVRIGSLIFFADSKVSTVIGLTENGFMVSDQYNDLIDDIVYVSNVELNASGHLIISLSDGTSIDAGIVKQINNFEINASQHLIANYNNGTSTDLGAIFSGNVNIAGNLTANSIIENMSNYSFIKQTSADLVITNIYAGVVKNGNKLTFVNAFNVVRTDTISSIKGVGTFGIPSGVGARLYPTNIGGNDLLFYNRIHAIDSDGGNIAIDVALNKQNNDYISTRFQNITDMNNLTLNKTYYVRIEATFLLSENLAS